MDVQADEATVLLPPLDERGGRRTRPRPDAQETERAARLLAGAERPVIVAGGGAITADAAADLVAVAEFLGAPVVTTWMGKGAIPEDHALNGWSVGDTASTSGNHLAASADVVLSVGCRFTDWSASSYRKGVTFAIPPSKLIQIDVDPREIGKNYPVEAALIGDARSALRDLLDALGQTTKMSPELSRSALFWRGPAPQSRVGADSGRPPRLAVRPITQTRALHELRQVLDRGTIVTSGAGVVQAAVRQDFPVYEPRTHLTSGGYSTMGFTVPAAIGAKLAQPDRTVVGIAGDGDFLQTMQEMATVAMLGTPVLFVVLNNSGWISIKGGQLANFGQINMTDFHRPDGSIYSPAYSEVARNFGLHGEKVEDPADIGPAVKRALATQGPALLEITVARDYPEAGATKVGWWDAPGPAVPSRATPGVRGGTSGRAAVTSGHRIFTAFYERMSVRVERAGGAARRQRLVGDLRGTVLEVGAGNGLNLKYYRQVERLVAVEPDRFMLKHLRRRAAEVAFPIEIAELSVERLPYPNATFDAVVTSLVLCSVPDQAPTLAELRRVLKPGGELRFLEHVRADGLGGKVLDALTPLWSATGGGCHPNRRTEMAITSAGFDIRAIERYVEGRLPHIQGVAIQPGIPDNEVLPILPNTPTPITYRTAPTATSAWCPSYRGAAPDINRSKRSRSPASDHRSRPRCGRTFSDKRAFPPCSFLSGRGLAVLVRHSGYRTSFGCAPTTRKRPAACWPRARPNRLHAFLPSGGDLLPEWRENTRPEERSSSERPQIRPWPRACFPRRRLAR